MSNHLVIPDSHTYPGDDLERYSMAGEFALKKRPDVIVEIGDWPDMESLCSYDFGKLSYEGRRYRKDTQASRDALDAFEKPIRDHNAKMKKQKRPQYKPRKVKIIGNHEYRILRAVSSDPKLDGVLQLEDLGFHDRDWEVQKTYQVPVEIDGVYYNHFFVSGVMGKPISGVNPARRIITEHMKSCTCGHIHIHDTATKASPDGSRNYGLVAGCFFEHSMDYALAVEHLWWRGLFLKHGVENGEYDLETWSMKRLKSGNW